MNAFLRLCVTMDCLRAILSAPLPVAAVAVVVLVIVNR